MDGVARAAKRVPRISWSDLKRRSPRHMLGIGWPMTWSRGRLGRTVASIIGARHSGMVIPKPGWSRWSSRSGTTGHRPAARIGCSGSSDEAIWEILERTGDAIQLRRSHLG